MSLDDIVNIAEKVLLVPSFYSDGESQLSMAASLIAFVIGAVIGRRAIRSSGSWLLTLLLIAVLIVTFLVFVAIRVGTDPVAAYKRANSHVTTEQVAKFKDKNGLNGTIIQQYFNGAYGNRIIQPRNGGIVN